LFTPYGDAGRIGVASSWGAASGFPRIATEEATKTLAAGAFRRTASRRRAVPSAVALDVPIGLSQD